LIRFFLPLLCVGLVCPVFAGDPLPAVQQDCPQVVMVPKTVTRTVYDTVTEERTIHVTRQVPRQEQVTVNVPMMLVPVCQTYQPVAVRETVYRRAPVATFLRAHRARKMQRRAARRSTLVVSEYSGHGLGTTKD